MKLNTYRGMPIKKPRDWVYGFYIEQIDNSNNIICFICQNKGPRKFIQTEVFPDSVGLSTGLKDKNGKEIFEGDIVEYYEFGRVYSKKPKISATVEYDRGGFSPLAIPGWEIVPEPFQCEVVGNIWERKNKK